MGHIHYFFLEDWKLVTDFQHTAGFRELYADQMGSRLIVVDDQSEGYIYSPVSIQYNSSNSSLLTYLQLLAIKTILILLGFSPMTICTQVHHTNPHITL
jgi:hypothetical protein